MSQAAEFRRSAQTRATAHASRRDQRSVGMEEGAAQKGRSRPPGLRLIPKKATSTHAAIRTIPGHGAQAGPSLYIKLICLSPPSMVLSVRRNVQDVSAAYASACPNDREHWPQSGYRFDGAEPLMEKMVVVARRIRHRRALSGSRYRPSRKIRHENSRLLGRPQQPAWPVLSGDAFALI